MKKQIYIGLGLGIIFGLLVGFILGYIYTYHLFADTLSNLIETNGMIINLNATEISNALIELLNQTMELQ